MESLETGRYCEKYEAAKLLGTMKANEAVPLLIEALKDSGLFVRERAAFALGEIGDKRAVPPLIELLLHKEKGSGTYLDAAKALGKIGDRRAIRPIMERFSKSHFNYCFVKALIRLDAREAIPLIEEKMPKGRLYDSDAEAKDNFEKFKRGEEVEWED
jgi:HEAT repeat protein